MYSDKSSPTTKFLPEEPLTQSGEDGFGFFPARLGILLNGSRYEIVRKLGWGRFSSTWLAFDSFAKTPEYYAIKILTVHATKAHHDGHLLESKVMKTINELESALLNTLEDQFEIDGPHGRHLCLVLPVLSETVGDFRRSAPSKSLHTTKVKNIVAEVVEALIELHGANIIHADLNADNVLFLDGTDPESIQEHLDRSTQVIEGDFELKGARYPIMRSQPILSTFHWDDPGITVKLYSFCLIDFGSAHWVNKQPAMGTTGAYALLAPEVILGADYGVKIDIWALGCMTFELLTGHSLFHPETEDVRLAKMMELTGEKFSDKMFAKCRKRDEYFDETGNLLRIGQLCPMTLERVMMNYGLPEAHAVPAASFIRACLHLDPDERPSARDLIPHKWVYSGYNCC